MRREGHADEERGGEGGPRRRAADRGRYGRLSRERVLAAAMAVVDAEGLSALSMRRLGAELGVEAMALYRYAQGKDELLDGLVEAFHLEAEALEPEPDGGGPTGAEGQEWRRRLHGIARAMHAVALRHPRVVPLLATRLLTVPLARRPAAVLRVDERVLEALDAAGLDEAAAVRAHRAFTAWLLGYLFADLRETVDAPEEPHPDFRLGLHLLNVRDFPRLRALAPAMAAPGGPAELAAGLDALLDRATADASPGRDGGSR
ncbi:TetR/AcrR family transcriptional regulator [Streptomyces sp. NPDC050585]|uniref:TetR/AcrR family transcriptional regulator n=1 Tax=Streptomyces sp. NPDC050585 TaxID=3365632 RepID=UPI00379A791F